MIRALIFDFDGLILDTETTAFRVWSQLYEEHGHVLALARWAQCIGTDHSVFDPYADLERQLGRPLDRAALRAQLRAREHELNHGQDARPGVRSVLARAGELGLHVGMASSSNRAWLTGHLGRLGLGECFKVIASRDDVQRVKPDPELYLRALAGLGVAPHEALALEDSPNGIRAAKLAGMHCVAIPNPVTAALPLGEADWVLDSLGSAPLDELLARVG